MFQQHPGRLRKPAKLHFRTTPTITTALQRESLRLNRTLSELLHTIVSEHFGYDPVTGRRLASGPGEPPSGGGPAGLAS